MYPNPQEALPLPAHPSLEQYRKRAKDLVKACKSGEPSAIHDWTTRWVEDLDAQTGSPTHRHNRGRSQLASAKSNSSLARGLPAPTKNIGNAR